MPTIRPDHDMMATMSTEVLVGLIGLFGALVGAGAAFAGVVYQQRHQAHQARRDRRDSAAEDAAQSILTNLDDIPDLITTLIRNEENPAASEETRLGLEHLSELQKLVRKAVHRIPSPELRNRVLDATHICFGPLAASHDFPSRRRSWARAMCKETQEALGCYLRLEPLPEESPFFRLARDDHERRVHLHNNPHRPGNQQ
jgi:hypothetical protein